MADAPLIQLQDGNAIPQLGLGVWQISNDDVVGAVNQAIMAGYRMIDTAQGYGNEEGVGRGVVESGLNRDAIFITSKVANRNQGYDKTLASFMETLGRLGVDWLDLFLIHWPVPAQDKYAETWKALVQLQKDGRIKSIGVSNFLPDHLERIIGETGVVPVVNQIELHPQFQQRDVREFHRQHGIAIESYSPLGRGLLLDDPTIAGIARKHGKSPAQAILRWHVQEELIVIPKSSSPERIGDNIAVFDFELDEDDMAAIAGLDKPDGKHGSNPAVMNNL
ncbi:aldo/keto reductase [uncultured Devosia sp.]|uniref:aldo/keto reductase n=1 Tax=uncultured Devosia sp. TaxID=211434 RepID=UPI0035CB1B39